MMKDHEIEKRFLITEVAQDFPYSRPFKKVEQGYIELESTNKNLRVRITNGRNAELTLKSGKGLVREEKEKKIAFDLGIFLTKNLCDFTLNKHRYSKDEWTVDFFQGPLKGVVIAEIEFKSLKDVPKNLKLPDWIGKGIDVTDSLTSHDLAKMVSQLKGKNPKKTLNNLLKWLKTNKKSS